MTSQIRCWCGHHIRYHGGNSCTFCKNEESNIPHPFGLKKPTELNPSTLHQIMAPTTPADKQLASVTEGRNSSPRKQIRNPAITPPDTLESNLINRENPSPTGLMKTIGGTLVGVILGIWVFVEDGSLAGLFALPFAGFLCGFGLAWVTGSDPSNPYSKEPKRRKNSIREIRREWNRKQCPEEDD